MVNLTLLNRRRLLCAMSLLTLSSFTPLAAQIKPEGIFINVTRLIYPANAKTQYFFANNETAHDYLLQTWIRQPEKKTLMPGDKNKTVFLIDPPMGLIKAKERKMFQLKRIGGNLPNDKESLFYATTRFIPEASSAQNKIPLIVTLNTKIFYRPKSIENMGGVSSIASTLDFRLTRGKLAVTNPSPFYATFSFIELGGIALDKLHQNLMLSPKSVSFFDLPRSLPLKEGERVKFALIDEWGFSLPPSESVIRSK